MGTFDGENSPLRFVFIVDSANFRYGRVNMYVQRKTKTQM